MDENFTWSPDAQSGIAVRWIEANGLRFEVAEALPGDGGGDRLALCLHGFPELHHSWRHQMPLLADMGYRVWAPNMRGYGGTTRPMRVAEYRLDILAEDVAALIDASGAKEVTLIAHDWGAIVAWHFAIKQLRPLANLVIMNVPHPKCGLREARHWHQLRKSWYIFFFQLPWLPEWFLTRNGGKTIAALIRKTSVNKKLFDKDALAPYREAADRPGAVKAMLAYYRALMRYGDGRSIGDGLVNAPTLVLWGEQDVAIDIRCLDGMDEFVPDLTVQRFPDASHWVQQDVPEQVNIALKNWLLGRS